MKRMKTMMAILLASIFVLGGCSADPYPEMTDAEYAVVVRYAASLLTRYNKGTADKLAYLDTEYTPEYLMAEEQNSFDGDTPAAPGAGTTDTTPDTPQNNPAPSQETNPQPEQNTEPEQPEQNTEPEQPEGGNTDTPEQTPPEETPQNTEPEMPPVQYTGIGESGLQTLVPNVRVEYTGYSVKSVYPDTQAQGAVTAAAGDKLLVIDFSVQNLTDVPVTFNTANRNPQFMLLINNDVQGFTMVTMIPNDLSGMDKELTPGERADAVLLMEVPESLAKSVDTLDLIIKIRGEDEQTVKLE